MEKNVASRLGAIAVGLGMAMAAGSGIAHAAPDSDKSPSASTSSERSEAKRAKAERETTDTGGDSDDERAGGTTDASGRTSGDAADNNKADNDEADDERPSRSEAIRSKADAREDESADSDTETAKVIDAPDTVAPTPAITSLPASAPEDSAEVVTAEKTEPETQLQGVDVEPESTSTPLAPAGALAWLTSVAAWAQREVDYFLHGGIASQSDPRQVVFDGSSLHGTLHVVGDERDWFTYELIDRPKLGSVEFSSDGGYVYTPDTYPTDGVTDSFTVAIRNHGFNLPTLVGLFSRSANTTTVAVGVDIPATEALAGDRDANDFDIYNFTSYTLRVTRKDVLHSPPSGPPIGALLAPGEFHRFYVNNDEQRENGSATVHYVSVDHEPGSVPAEYTLTMTQNASRLSTDKWITCEGGCLPASLIGGTTAVMVDEVGKRTDVYSGHAQKQSEVLNRLCAESSVAKCSFTATSREIIAGDREVAAAFANWSDHTVSYSRSVSLTVTDKVSVQVGAKASVKIANIVSIELAEQYQQEWTTSKAVTHTADITVPPMTVAYLYLQQSMIRFTGDFTLTAGNTTWVLHDVYFDLPDKSSDTGHPTWSPDYEPLEPAGVENASIETLA